ncbi:MAG: haloacid dehalogenase type II [Phycisphaeraceae bacterium]|nr:haloacid dehalogenase type II [Phycisphaeraceae bacterium]
MEFDRFECMSFDCYGTLIDWETGILEALRPVLAAHGVRADDERLLEMYGAAESEVQAGPYRPYRAVLRDVLAKLGGQLGFTTTVEQSDAFTVSVRDWPSFADSRAALRALGKRFRLIILSNIDDDLFEFSRQRLDVTFDRIFTAQQIGSYKPSPGNFEHLVAHAGVPRDRLLHVAQSLYHDIGPARDAGLATVWVNRRHDREGSGATPRATGAVPDLTVPDLQTLAALSGAN